jgi:hypothetical protein
MAEAMHSEAKGKQQQRSVKRQKVEKTHSSSAVIF